MLTSVLLGALILHGQVASPVQNPAQGSPPPKAQLTKEEEQHQKDLENDIAVGKKAVIEVEKTEKLSDNKEYQDRVNRIGQELAAIAQVTPVEVYWGDKRLNKFDYTFKVLKGDDVNAFTLPGGFVYVYEGLIKYVQSDDELAAVLGHEMSHAEQRHYAQLVKEQSKITTPGLIAILAALATRNPGLIGTAVYGTQLTAQSFMSTWSVNAEKSADHGGFQYLVHSKYNPTAMLTFMERLAMDENTDAMGAIVWGIFETHPPSKDRAESILKDMRAYGIPIQRSAVTTRFRTEVKPGQDGGVDIWFNKRKLYTFGGTDALKRADDAASKLNQFFDQEPNLFDVKFQAEEILGRRSPLFEVLPEDAELEKTTTDKVGAMAVEAIKGGLYDYGFSIWQAKG